MITEVQRCNTSQEDVLITRFSVTPQGVLVMTAPPVTMVSQEAQVSREQKGLLGRADSLD